MKQEDIKYIYEIDSTLDIDNIIDLLKQELKLEEGKINYFSQSEDDLIEEKLTIDQLKKKALEVSSNDESPTIIFPNVEIIVDNDEGRIQIVSKIKLSLKGVNIDKTIKK